MSIWLGVTNDEFQFPVYIANSSYEMEKICGVDAGHIRHSNTKGSVIKKVNLLFVKIEEGEDNELDIAEETKRLYQDGLEYNAALRLASEMYKKKSS